MGADRWSLGAWDLKREVYGNHEEEPVIDCSLRDGPSPIPASLFHIQNLQSAPSNDDLKENLK